MRFDDLVRKLLQEGSLEGTITPNTYHIITMMASEEDAHQIRKDALIELPVKGIQQASDYVCNNIAEIYEKTPRLFWQDEELEVDADYQADPASNFGPCEPEFVDTSKQIAGIPLDDAGNNIIVVGPQSPFFGKPIAAANYWEWKIVGDLDAPREQVHGADEKHMKKDWTDPIWQSSISKGNKTEEESEEDDQADWWKE